jgi:hypothetical protein
MSQLVLLVMANVGTTFFIEGEYVVECVMSQCSSLPSRDGSVGRGFGPNQTSDNFIASSLVYCNIMLTNKITLKDIII